MNYLVFIHGWNEDSAAFESFIKALSRQQYAHTHIMGMVDFLSLDDEVTFDDLVTAMEHAWHSYGIPTSGKTVDVVTHSTGALIFRAWLNKYYSGKSNPISNLLMLAPPNFGSHLAHKGRAFVGRVLKGFGHHRPFEVGSNLLKGLELASSFTWGLAKEDCFGENAPFHSKDILTTVLIGGNGYEGLASAANEPGSDGTVPIACADLSPCYVTVRQNFSGPLSYDIQKSKNEIAFGVVKNINHSSILGEGGVFPYDIDICIKALAVKEQDFYPWRQQLAVMTSKNYSKIGVYQNIVTKVSNQYKKLVADYHMDFDYGEFDFYNNFVKSVHVFQEDSGYRSFKVDLSHLMKKDGVLELSMTAFPSVYDKHSNVGYMPCDRDHNNSFKMSAHQIRDLFMPQTTLMIDWQIAKKQKHKVFAIHKENKKIYELA